MSDIDLMPFCGGTDGRNYLRKPFSLGDHTYSTNGRLLVRVARRADVPECADLPESVATSIDVLVTPPSDVSWMVLDLDTLKLPDVPEQGDCSKCGGRCSEHDCPDCCCKCPRCEGTGKEPVNQSGTICGVGFDLKYVRRMVTLPGLALAMPVSAEGPLHFRFEGGGVGALMPLRTNYDDNVELIQKREAA